MLAGVNGAGKSTFYEQFLSEQLPFLNADRIAADQGIADPFMARTLADRLRNEQIDAGASFAYETVFSHPDRLDALLRARAAGYEITLVFIHLDHEQLNNARIAQRVRAGGHYVAPEKVHDRLPRTLALVRVAITICDHAFLFDNSSADMPFQRVATVHRGVATSDPTDLPAWARDLLADLP